MEANLKSKLWPLPVGTPRPAFSWVVAVLTGSSPGGEKASKHCGREKLRGESGGSRKPTGLRMVEGLE